MLEVMEIPSPGGAGGGGAGSGGNSPSSEAYGGIGGDGVQAPATFRSPTVMWGTEEASTISWWILVCRWWRWW